MDNPQRLLTHFDELLKRLRRSMIWVFVGLCIGYYFANEAVLLLEEPLLARLPEGAKIIFTTPFEKFWAYLKVAALVGTAAVIPLIGWELAAFIGPALKRREKSRILWLLMSFGVVFVLGLYCGYRFVLPPLLDAIMRYGGSEMPFLSISAYVNAAIGVLIFTAFFLELPVIMLYLTLWGWVQAASWSKGRKLAFVLNAIISAILSPPDIMSMIVMMVPLAVLYEFGIWGARLVQWVKGDTKPEPEVIP